ncbi:hypothetical protein M430DRAFT_148061 [Amorphotheca resinae ATCC 22711]|uniref:CsbD-like domain-containing protein n=1 Tax=Amorphotheca resinae ATCC 22711 TaxID=857342 RepID=A0A2T3APS7_AMORE|nr:hypothetical protein M430DRAFT_148061 [Amorphotheca resinae ATCC 22711]PSS07007.1 hypothetical protein M430DRAFT_148061 [Amorphotheca resinae ATCC 22711]
MSSVFSQTVFRSSRTIAFAPRAFSTSLVAQRTAAQAAKDTLKTVDRKVSDKLVDGIEVGQSVTEKAKRVTGIGSTSDAKAKAQEVAGEAKGKAHEVAGEAKGKAHGVAGEVKGKAEELKGDIKGKL